MQPHRLVELDAVAVDEALAFAGAVGPGGDFSADFGFGEREQLIERIENRLFAVAVHHFLKAPLAQARRAHLGRAGRR